ncbi:MAG: hypothetical protein RL419_469 [Actinomycetota bacterium]
MESTDHGDEFHESHAATAVSPGLWLVATPIGNMGDMTTRARDVLRTAKVVCCEDTRRSGRLLAAIAATPERLMVVNEHTEHEAIDAVADLVANGHVVALISDAGTPAISDPGERLVRAMVERSLPVWCAPGPAALIAAVIVSGFPTHRFVFEGFLPRDGAERRERLADVARERRTCVLYEAPHRIERTLTDLAEACGPNRLVCLGRELTKMHEELWRGTLAEAVERTRTTEPRGEFVLVLEGTRAITADVTDADIVKALNDRRGVGLSTRDSVDEVSTVLNVSRKRVYDLATSSADPGAKGRKKRKT